MAAHHPDVCWQVEHEDRSFSEIWHHHRITTTEEAFPLIDELSTAMADDGYGDKDIFGMRLILEEAIVNAIKHGNRYDPNRHVQVRWSIAPGRVLAEVEDEGAGFDPFEVPDPTDAENLERPCGRGLLLIRSYATWVRYNDRGNRVTVCKMPSQAASR